MGTRDEVNQLTDAATNFGTLLADDTPNAEQKTEFLEEGFMLVKEAADMAGVPKVDRLKAIGLAFAQAGAKILGKAISFSDESAPV